MDFFVFLKLFKFISWISKRMRFVFVCEICLFNYRIRNESPSILLKFRVSTWLKSWRHSYKRFYFSNRNLCRIQERPVNNCVKTYHFAHLLSHAICDVRCAPCSISNRNERSLFYNVGKCVCAWVAVRFAVTCVCVKRMYLSSQSSSSRGRSKRGDRTSSTLHTSQTRTRAGKHTATHTHTYTRNAHTSDT